MSILNEKMMEAAKQLAADLHFMTHSVGSKSGRVVKFGSKGQAADMVHRLQEEYERPTTVLQSAHATRMAAAVVGSDLDKQEQGHSDHEKRLSEMASSLESTGSNDAHKRWVFDFSQFPVHVVQEELHLPQEARVTNVAVVNGRHVFLVENISLFRRTKPRR